VGALEPDAELRALYRDLALVFSEPARCKQVWTVGLEGWSMTRSALVEGWVEEGWAEGRAEGRAEEAQELLLAVGQKRLGQPGKTVVQRVQQIRALELLRRLHLRAMEVETWEDLLAGV